MDSKLLEEINELVEERKKQNLVREIMDKTRVNMLVRGKEAIKMKTAIQSKTVIFNVLSVVLAALMFTSTIPMSSEFKDLIVAVIGVVNVGLRFVTTQPIKGII